MHFEIALMGLAVHILLWDKLPNWGTWFTSLIAAMPAPIQTLYRQWNCSYCAGFWIAIALHAVTGLWTIPALADMPASAGVLSVPIAWFLDAISSALLIFAGTKLLGAMGRSELMVRVIDEAPTRSNSTKVPAKLVA